MNEATIEDRANTVVMNEEHKSSSRLASEVSHVQRHESIFRFFSKRRAKSEGVLWPNARARRVRIARPVRAPDRWRDVHLDVSEGEP